MKKKKIIDLALLHFEKNPGEALLLLMLAIAIGCALFVQLFYTVVLLAGYYFK